MHLCFRLLKEFKYPTQSFPLQTWLRQELDDGEGRFGDTLAGARVRKWSGGSLNTFFHIGPRLGVRSISLVCFRSTDLRGHSLLVWDCTSVRAVLCAS